MGRIASESNNLKVKFPDLVKEWHPTKNDSLKPENLLPGSHKKIWWLCKFGHEWEAIVYNRTGRQSQCPKCSNHISRPALYIYCELKKIFKNVYLEHRIGNLTVDIYVEDINLVIEYDGYHYHKSRLKSDKIKKDKILKNNISLINVRVSPLEKIYRNDIVFEYEANPTFKMIDVILNKIINQKKFCDEKQKSIIDKYLDIGKLQNTRLYNKMLKSLPGPVIEKSLFFKNKKISKEWHPTKNGKLTPKDFYSGSDFEAWWICKKGHEWKAKIDKRNKGRGCPYCSGKKIGYGNDFKSLYPKISKEWHPTKNGSLKPENVRHGSDKKVWWLCKFGHEWETPINRRSLQKSNCPYCSGHKVSEKNRLSTLYPEIAKEWHPTRNGSLLHSEVSISSNKKIWWMCQNGQELEMKVNSVKVNPKYSSDEFNWK